MVKQRLAQLERAAGNLGAARCPQCGGSHGVGGVPLVTFFGKSDGVGTYNADGRCSRCGAAPPHVVDIVTPPLPGGDPAHVEQEQ